MTWGKGSILTEDGFRTDNGKKILYYVGGETQEQAAQKMCRCPHLWKCSKAVWMGL